MTIMYILPSEHFGGAEQQAVLQIRALEARGHDVVPVVGPGDLISNELHRVGVHDQIIASTFPVTDASDRSWIATLKQTTPLIAAHVRTRRAIIELALERDVDVVFGARVYGWILAASVASTLDLPYVIRAGSRSTRQAERVGIGALRRWAGAPSLVVANCEAVREDIAPLFGSPSTVIRNIVDTQRFRTEAASPRFRTLLGIDDGTPVVGLAARPAPGKGLELFLRAALRVAQRRPEVRFLVAGEFSWRRHYEQMARQQGANGHVTFLGHVSDMENFYASCDVSVLTSPEHSIEGSPNALLEAMSTGRPVVSTDVGGVDEMIDDGVEGYLVRDDDHEGFAERVIALLGSDALRLRLGTAGRQRVLRDYSEQRSGDALADTIERVVAGRTSRHQLAPDAVGARRMVTTGNLGTE